MYKRKNYFLLTLRKDNKMTKHYLNTDGSRWYIRINNISDENKILRKEYIHEFPYYVIFDKNITEISQEYPYIHTNIVAVYPSLKQLKQNERKDT